MENIEVVENEVLDTESTGVIADLSSSRMTVPGSDAAKNGVSLQGMVGELIGARMAENNAMLLSQIAAMMGGNPPQVQAVAAVTTPKAVGKKAAGKGAAVVAQVVAGKAPKAEREVKAKFDAAEYFQLGPKLVQLKPDAKGNVAYIAKTTNPDFEANPYAVVGVQRKTIMLSLEKAAAMHALLGALLKRSV